MRRRPSASRPVQVRTQLGLPAAPVPAGADYNRRRERSASVAGRASTATASARCPTCSTAGVDYLGARGARRADPPPSSRRTGERERVASASHPRPAAVHPRRAAATSSTGRTPVHHQRRRHQPGRRRPTRWSATHEGGRCDRASSVATVVGDDVRPGVGRARRCRPTRCSPARTSAHRPIVGRPRRRAPTIVVTGRVRSTRRCSSPRSSTSTGWALGDNWHRLRRRRRGRPPPRAHRSGRGRQLLGPWWTNPDPLAWRSRSVSVSPTGRP